MRLPHRTPACQLPACFRVAGHRRTRIMKISCEGHRHQSVPRLPSFTATSNVRAAVLLFKFCTHLTIADVHLIWSNVAIHVHIHLDMNLLESKPHSTYLARLTPRLVGSILSFKLQKDEDVQRNHAVSPPSCCTGYASRR